ncbi:MAG: branched-chain amino acid ABC transporter permease [Roseomonas sp.]|nr:branched-chain amino acid ABC transporter permease [Roseomonas sp.]MCA3392213.1 branched-chain amino acid ABC transporter permease [Roseomonas sp.]MCA3409054.1 branched-chain amino acid ABC transporter permease [Roseomonas sp.]
MLTVAGRTGSILLGCAALAVASLPLFASPYHLELVSTAVVLAMFALSLQLLVGVTGLVSLGHAAFFGIGAYAIHLMGAYGPSLSILLTLPAAVLLSGLAAFAVGALALRTRNFFFLMTTLAFGQMLFFVFHDTPLGGGADGVFVTRPSFSLFGLEWIVSRQDRPTVMLLVNLAVLVAMYLGLTALLRTMFGRALLGIRANEHRMRSMGFDTYWLQLGAFTLAGAMAGIAGHMWGMTQAFVSPELLAWHRSAEALLMILLGGLGALHGPILGAFAFVGLGEVAQLITERQRLVEGLVILAVVLGLRNGLAGIRLPASWRAQPNIKAAVSPKEVAP